MRRELALVGLGAALAIGIASRARRRKRAPVLALFGDSNAQGLIPHVKLLAERAGVRLQSGAIGGSGVLEWAVLPTLPMITSGATVVVTSLGGNDRGRTWVAPELFEAAILKVKLLCQGKAFFRLDASFPTLPDETGIDKLWSRAGIPDLRPPKDIPRASDDIHYTIDGYRQLAAWIWEQLHKRGLLPSVPS